MKLLFATILCCMLGAGCSRAKTNDQAQPASSRPSAAQCEATPCYCASDDDCPITMSCHAVSTPGSPNVCGPKSGG